MNKLLLLALLLALALTQTNLQKVSTTNPRLITTPQVISKSTTTLGSSSPNLNSDLAWLGNYGLAQNLGSNGVISTVTNNGGSSDFNFGNIGVTSNTVGLPATTPTIGNNGGSTVSVSSTNSGITRTITTSSSSSNNNLGSNVGSTTTSNGLISNGAQTSNSTISNGGPLSNGAITLTTTRPTTTSTTSTTSTGLTGSTGLTRSTSSTGICCEVKPECKQFNTAVGICEVCYSGYETVDGKCVIADILNSVNRGCKRFENNTCVECSQRYVFNANRTCQQVDNSCLTWLQNGSCQTCYRGYVLQNITCIVDTTRPAGLNDTLCAVIQGDVCITCAERSYLNQQGRCTRVNDNCNTWDILNGQCLSCYKGYNLANLQCVIAEQRGPTDLGCKTWNWDNQTCLECSQRWRFNPQGVCVPLDVNCQTFNTGGNCTACYKGYIVQSGGCVSDPTNLNPPTDLGCKTWDWDKQICLECSARWRFNAQGICIPYDANCQTFNTAGNCTLCFKGYIVQNGSCILDPINLRGPTDLGCKTWDWDKQICLECSQRFVFNAAGVCTALDINCRTFGTNTTCIECYKGYVISNGSCALNPTNQRGPIDLGCARWDWDKQICLECSQRWIFGNNGVCVPLDTNCATFNSTGACTQCYKGYELQGATCVLSQVRGPTDLGCKTWNWDTQVCLECSPRWVFNQQKVCVPIDNNCQTFNAANVCTACYKGYIVQNASCVLNPTNLNQPIDLGCKTWNWDNQTCLECSLRWRFNAQGTCIPLDSNCQTFDTAGNCTQCYKGYIVQNGGCVLDPTNLNPPTDIGCKTWDWDRQICLECSNRWRFNAQGRCVQFDVNCLNFTTSGDCTTCYKGYVVQNNSCVLNPANLNPPIDLGCKTWNWDNQTCL